MIQMIRMQRWMLAVSIYWVVTGASIGYSDGMEYPLAVVAGPNNVIYVADRNLPGIWKIESGTASVYFKASKKFRTPLNAVRCLALDRDGKLLAGDSSTREVYRFDTADSLVPLTGGGIGIPTAMALDSKGDLLVCDLELHCIFIVPANGGAATEFVKVPAPRGIAVDSQDRVWVVSHSKEPIVRFTKEKAKEVVVSEAVFQFAHQIVVDDSGDAYVSDGYAKSIWKIPSQGRPEKFFSGEPFVNPVGLAKQGERLLVADPHQKMIYSVPLTGAKVIKPELK